MVSILVNIYEATHRGQAKKKTDIVIRVIIKFLSIFW